jgi:hypothetical protein
MVKNLEKTKNYRKIKKKIKNSFNLIGNVEVVWKLVLILFIYF